MLPKASLNGKCALCLLLLAGSAAGTDFPLVSDGKSVCVVQKTGNKTVDADIAFFTNGIARMSGTELVVVESGSCRKDVADSALPLQLGTTTNRIVFEIREADLLHEDDYEIAFPDERTMKIVGTETSCRWALNALLEEAGAVFCMPGPHGTHWPQMRSLAFTRKPRRATASIRLERDLFQEDLDWQRAMNGKKQKGRFFWHNLNAIFPIKTYGQEPWCSKIMPEQGGKRTCPKSWEARWQPCFASQDGIDEAVRRIREHLRRHPGEKVYSLAVNDLEGYCECAACRKLNGGFEKKSDYVTRFVDHSPSYYAWVNAVVRGVRKEFPDVVFGLLAYCGTIDPPPFALEPNVVPYLCFDIQQLSDPKARALRERLLSEWSKKCSALGIWDYAFGLPGYAVPREYPDEQGLYFGYKTGLCPKLEGFFTEGMISAVASEAKKRYLYYRLAWDSTRSAKEESDRWCRACVGDEAAPHLIAYYELWKDFWHSKKLRQTPWYRDGAGSVYFAYGSLDYLFALDEATRRRSSELMAAVVAAAERSGTPDQRKRASYLKHVEDYLSARQAASCLGYADEKGEFATAADAARYLRDLPKIEAAAAAVVAARADIFADAKECPSPRVKERLSKFKEYADGGNTSRLTNRALAYCATDKTVDALFRNLYPRAFDPAAKNLAILSDPAADAAAWELQKRGVAAKRVESADGTPRYALTTRDPKCYWQAALKIVRDGVRPSTPYVCTARVTNPTKRPISVQLQAQTVAGDSLAPSDLGQHNVVTVPPGESRTVAVFTVTHHRKDGVARIGVIPHGLGADTVYVDNLRLVEVTSKREEAGDVILHDDFSGKNPVPWKINESAFTYSDNEGVGGSRALVWECDEPTDAWHAVSCTFPCEVGRDYTCRIKVRDTKPIIGRAFVRIGCHGKDGKHPFVSVDGRPIVNNHWKGVREDFVEVTSCTPPAPSGAVTGFVEIAVRTMTTGRLVFDDFEVIRGGYTWIRYLQSGAYRDEAVGGEVKFAAFYDYDDAKCPLADRRAFFEYVDGRGKAKRVAAAELTETAFTGMLDVGDFAYGTNLVTAILTDAGGRELDRRQLPFAHLRELPKRRVTIDSHRRVVVDGKPFFPVGCYNCGKDEAKSDLYASAGFNCAISDKNDAIERMRKRGIKVIRISYAGDTNRIRSVVSRYAGDPNVIAWYTADELPLGFAKRQAAAIRCFHDLDPDRPAFTVLDRPKTARDLLESFDIIGSDPYPVSSAENRIGIAGECADLCVSATFGMRPLWQVCQAFDWHWHRRNFRAEMSEHHFPYPDEFANLVWQSVAAGATGIFWYDFDWWESYIPAEQRESSWACFKDTTAKLLKYSDVFLSVEPAPVAHVDAKGIRVRTWSLNGVNYLLVVNTDQEKSVRARVTGLKAVRASAEFGAVPQVKDGDLLLDLPKLGVSFAVFECGFRGRVSGGGCPMKGVAVTDGLNVVTTDADGRFVLPRREGARFISVTVPSGWRASQHYRVVAEGVPSYDFALEPWGASAPGRELRFVHIADSEITRIGAPEKRMFAHVKDVADREEAAFVIHTGDLWRGSGLKAHIELMNSGTMGRPMFYAIGNHDLSKEGAYGEWQFESLYGPSWYSFDAGGVHFCVTPVKKGDGIPSYTADNVAEWLKNDLAVVPKGRPVVIFNHSFWDCRLFDVSHIRDGTLKLGAFDVTAACNLTGLVFGHHHTNQFRRFGKIAVIQTSNPQMGGVDLSPANVRVVKVDGGGRLTSASHFSPCDVWPVVTQAKGKEWVTKVPGPVYLGTPVTDGNLVFVGTLDDDGLGTGSVTALDPETGRIAWSAKTPNSIKNQLVVFKGLVIAQDGDGAVHAYDCRTGREAWVHDPENATLRPHQFGLALNAELGLVYCEIDLGFTALDARTGEVRWVCEGFKLWGSTASRPVCGEGIVTGEINWHGLYAFDARTGRMVWRRDRFGKLGSKETLRLRAGAVTIADDRVYATADRGMRVLDSKTGATIRERNFDFATTTTTTPLLFGGRVLIGSCGAGLVALDQETLDVVWKGPVGEALVVNGSYCQAPQHQVATAPVRVDATTVAAAAGDGTVRFWDVGSGRETRRVTTGVPHFSAPLVVGRKLVIADFAGYVRAVDLTLPSK